jgi:hypothetical protein
MKILIGFPDESGRGKVMPIAGAEVADGEKVKIFFAAKQRHQFPKGTKRLELLDCTVQETAIFIGDHVADEAAAFAEAAEKRTRADAEARKALAKARTDMQAATKLVSTTAVKRSAAASKLNAAKLRLAEAVENKNMQAGAAAGKAGEAAEKEFTAADQTWQDAKAAKAELEKPATEAKLETK